MTVQQFKKLYKGLEKDSSEITNLKELIAFVEAAVTINDEKLFRQWNFDSFQEFWEECTEGVDSKMSERMRYYYMALYRFILKETGHKATCKAEMLDLFRQYGKTKLQISPKNFTSYGAFKKYLEKSKGVALSDYRDEVVSRNNKIVLKIRRKKSLPFKFFPREINYIKEMFADIMEIANDINKKTMSNMKFAQLVIFSFERTLYELRKERELIKRKKYKTL